METERKIIVVLVLSVTVAGCGQSLSATAQSAQNERFSFVEDARNKNIDILLDGDSYTSYRYADSLKKPVLFPLRTRDGHFVTRGWPVQPRVNERTDHPHHIGLWFNYGDVNGLDFWNNSPSVPAEKRMGYGSIHHAAVNAMQTNGSTAVLDVTKYWLGPQGDSLLKEGARYVFHVDEEGNTSIELDFKLTAMEDVSFNDNKEGMLAIRLARELEHPSDEPLEFTGVDTAGADAARVNNERGTGHYVSSEGVEGDGVWGTRGKWVALNGTIDGEHVSLVILDHAENPGYPTYWHARGYGLFAANPLGQEAFSDGKHVLGFKLENGASARFRYKVLIHSGSKLDAATIHSRSVKYSGR